MTTTSLMRDEMAQQPEILGRHFMRRERLIAEVRALVPVDLAGITLVGRGSSEHAALYGRYLLQLCTSVPVTVAAPSVHTLYNRRTRARGWLVVGLSQSGWTLDVVATLERLRRDGARTIAITNGTDGPLARAAELVVDLDAGDERAVPATKTFTAELAALVLLADALGEVPWTAQDLANVPRVVADVLADDRSASDVAVGLAVSDALLTTGRGYLFPVALEAALKLKEAAHIHAEGHSSGELLHGPVTLAGGDVPVVVFRVPGAPTGAVMRDLVHELRHRCVPVITVGADDDDLPVPAGLPEPLHVLPTVVRAQQLAHHCGQLRGLDPDNPVGLEKVTI